MPSTSLRRILPAAAVLTGLFWGSVPAAGQASRPPLEIFHGFTLIDGLGGPPVPDAAIGVRGNSIVAVGSRRELLAGPSAPIDALVIDLGGGYVIPGLIDAHVHLATSPDRAMAEAELYRLLLSGVTAVRDMAGDARMLASLARDSRLGEIDAPDVHFSALMAGPSFFSDPRPRVSAEGEAPGGAPWVQAITPATDLVRAVAMAKGTYATGVKIYADLAAPEVERIAHEAHRQGMRVWAHSMVFPARPLEVVRSGVDVVSHVCYLGWEAMAEAPDRYHHDRAPRYNAFVPDAPVFTELFREMRTRGTILDATLALYARDERAPAPATRAAPVGQCDTEFARSLVRRAHAGGVAIAAGSDFTAPPRDPFPALYLELEELVEYGGLSPMDAILAATSVAARATGIDSIHGTLTEGRPVNFVLLREDPLADITNLRSIEAVWKNAVRYDRASYRSRFPRRSDPVAASRPLVATPSATPDALLEDWLAMWRRYDLDAVDELFLDGGAVTYFAADREGPIRGLDSVRDYHAGLGFVPGGFRPSGELWLEDVTISDAGESAVVTAVWHFGTRVSREAAGRGPLTMVLMRDGSRYRISHVNFGNYAPQR